MHTNIINKNPDSNTISATVSQLGNDAWSIADSLWTALPTKGDVKNTILPFMVLRRLDCVLEPSKQKVLEAAKKLKFGSLRRPCEAIC